MRWFWCISLLCAGSLVYTAEPVDGIGGLDQARQEVALLREREDLLTTWQRDQADLQRLVDARQVSIAEKSKRLEALRKQSDARRAEAAQRDAGAEHLHEEEAHVRAVLASVHDALVHAVPDASGIRGVDEQRPVVELLRQLGEDLQKTITAAGQWEVEIGEGRLPDGTSIPVQVLKAGFVAAWYVSLDGSSAGSATRDHDAWKLQALPDRPRASIVEAIGQVRGNSPPKIVLLPPPVSTAGSTP